MGMGNTLANLMLLGEAPGRREDDLEKPFQGRAGQLLDEVLKKIGIDRSQVWIDNVVRCRPPENRTPTEDEIKACAVYLREIVGIIKPRVVVAMGGSALLGVLGKAGIKKHRGRKFWSERWGFLVIPTWHPAYCCRTPEATKELEMDLRLAITSLGVVGL